MVPGYFPPLFSSSLVTRPTCGDRPCRASALRASVGLSPLCRLDHPLGTAASPLAGARRKEGSLLSCVGSACHGPGLHLGRDPGWWPGWKSVMAQKSQPCVGDFYGGPEGSARVGRPHVDSLAHYLMSDPSQPLTGSVAWGQRCHLPEPQFPHVQMWLGKSLNSWVSLINAAPTAPTPERCGWVSPSPLHHSTLTPVSP